MVGSYFFSILLAPLTYQLRSGDAVRECGFALPAPAPPFPLPPFGAFPLPLAPFALAVPLPPPAPPPPPRASLHGASFAWRSLATLAGPGPQSGGAGITLGGSL